MRRFLIACREFCCVVLAVFCAGAVFTLTRLPAFAQGERYEISHGANSSAQTEETPYPLFYKLTNSTKGESVRYNGDRFSELKEYYKAEIVFEEEAAGVHNYYLFSSKLGDPVNLDGKLVNLHIAISAEQTAVGTPLIFGGY